MPVQWGDRNKIEGHEQQIHENEQFNESHHRRRLNKRNT